MNKIWILGLLLILLGIAKCQQTNGTTTNTTTVQNTTGTTIGGNNSTANSSNTTNTTTTTNSTSPNNQTSTNTTVNSTNTTDNGTGTTSNATVNSTNSTDNGTATQTNTTVNSTNTTGNGTGVVNTTTNSTTNTTTTPNNETNATGNGTSNATNTSETSTGSLPGSVAVNVSNHSTFPNNTVNGSGTTNATSCDNSCKTCSVSNDNASCTSCHDDSFLVFGHCICQGSNTVNCHSQLQVFNGENMYFLMGNFTPNTINNWGNGSLLTCDNDLPMWNITHLSAASNNSKVTLAGALQDHEIAMLSLQLNVFLAPMGSVTVIVSYDDHNITKVYNSSTVADLPLQACFAAGNVQYYQDNIVNWTISSHNQLPNITVNVSGDGVSSVGLRQLAVHVANCSASCPGLCSGPGEYQCLACPDGSTPLHGNCLCASNASNGNTTVNSTANVTQTNVTTNTTVGENGTNVTNTTNTTVVRPGTCMAFNQTGCPVGCSKCSWLNGAAQCFDCLPDFRMVVFRNISSDWTGVCVPNNTNVNWNMVIPPLCDASCGQCFGSTRYQCSSCADGSTIVTDGSVGICSGNATAGNTTVNTTTTNTTVVNGTDGNTTNITTVNSTTNATNGTNSSDIGNVNCTGDNCTNVTNTTTVNTTVTGENGTNTSVQTNTTTNGTNGTDNSTVNGTGTGNQTNSTNATGVDAGNATNTTNTTVNSTNTTDNGTVTQTNTTVNSTNSTDNGTGVQSNTTVNSTNSTDNGTNIDTTTNVTITNTTNPSNGTSGTPSLTDANGLYYMTSLPACAANMSTSNTTCDILNQNYVDNLTFGHFSKYFTGLHYLYIEATSNQDLCFTCFGVNLTVTGVNGSSFPVSYDAISSPMTGAVKSIFMSTFTIDDVNSWGCNSGIAAGNTTVLWCDFSLSFTSLDKQVVMQTYNFTFITYMSYALNALTNTSDLTNIFDVNKLPTRCISQDCSVNMTASAGLTLCNDTNCTGDRTTNIYSSGQSLIIKQSLDDLPGFSLTLNKVAVNLLMSNGSFLMDATSVTTQHQGLGYAVYTVPLDQCSNCTGNIMVLIQSNVVKYTGGRRMLANAPKSPFEGLNRKTQVTISISPDNWKWLKSPQLAFISFLIGLIASLGFLSVVLVSKWRKGSQMLQETPSSPSSVEIDPNMPFRV